MRRRDFIARLAGAATAWPLTANAQKSANIPRIGFLRLGPASSQATRVEALRAGLRELGYVEGKNISFEFRFSETIEQLSKFADELIRMKVDIIFATSSTEVGVVRRLTKTIPIVFGTHADPMGVGHVASSRSSRREHHRTVDADDRNDCQSARAIERLIPRATRFGVLFTPTAPSHVPTLQAAEAVGAKLRIALHKVSVQSVDDFDAAFAKMSLERVDGVLVHGSSLTGTHTASLAALTLKHRLPTLFTIRDNVEAGGLMSYSPDLLDLTRRSAAYVDKILRGAKPGELPVEQATKFELVVNNKTAKAIGLTIPELFLLRADQVID